MLDRDIQDSRITAIERDGYLQEPSVTPMFSGEIMETIEVSDEEMAEIMQRRYAKC
jgi:hypothetical protein